MEVLFEGVLEMHVGHNPSSESHKDWKPRLFVLKRYKDAERSTLDYYKNTKKRWQKQQVPMGVISLWPWFSVSLAHNCTYKFSLCVTTAECTVYVAAMSCSIMNKWHYHLQTQRILDVNARGSYVFTVQPQDSEAMNCLGARGECLLAVSKAFDIICALSSTRQVVGVWPLDSLRRYWCENGVFGFEAGRRSPRGVGEYIFVTPKDEQIYAVVHKSVEKAGRTSSVSSSDDVTSDIGARIEKRPPAPLPEGAEKEGLVLTSDSDEGGLPGTLPAPELPPKPPNLKMSPMSRRRVFGRAVTTNSIPAVSLGGGGDSPPVVRGERSSTGVLQRSKSGKQMSAGWLHQAIRKKSPPPKIQNSADGGKGDKLSPPTSTGKSIVFSRPPLTQDDTYSHTVHKFPGVFSDASEEHNVVSGSLYHALVHKGEDGSLVQKKHIGSQEDSSMYDLAYPPSAQVRPALLPSNQVADLYDMPYKTDVNSPKEMKTPLTAPLGAVRVKLKQEDLSAARASVRSEGLTLNPLYGSQDNLLSQMAALEDSQELLDDKAAMCGSMTGAEPTSSVKRNECPGTADGKNGLPLDTNKAAAIRNAVDPPSTGEMDLLESSREESGQSAEDSFSMNPGSIERDAAGYSKVKKGKEKGSSPPPPPIPERKYSNGDS